VSVKTNQYATLLDRIPKGEQDANASPCSSDLCWSRIRLLGLTWGLCGGLVFVEESSEVLSALDALWWDREVDQCRVVIGCVELVAVALVAAAGVVVVDVGIEHGLQVALAGDEYSVGAFAADARR
jgi:hypothetical protein